MDVFAQRELTCRDDSGQDVPMWIQIGVPRPDGQGVWRCDYRIGAPYSFEGRAYGEDGMQALLLGVQAINAHCHGPLAGRVTWQGMPDLGLEHESKAA